MNDAIDHPAHYNVAGEKHEAIKIIDDWRLGFSLGNAVKYILRAKHKGSEIQDLEKALWYLKHAGEIGEKPPTGREIRISLGAVCRAWSIGAELRNVLMGIFLGETRHTWEELSQHVQALKERTAK